MIGLPGQHLLEIRARIFQTTERIAAGAEQEHARHVRGHGVQGALAVLLRRLRVTVLKCGRGAQIVGRAVAGTLGQERVEQRIGLDMVARRDQRLGERKARREIVGRRLELPAIITAASAYAPRWKARSPLRPTSVG